MVAGGLSPSRIGAAALSIALTSAVMILLGIEHGPAGATTLIVSLGFMTTPGSLAMLMAGVVCLAALVWESIARWACVCPCGRGRGAGRCPALSSSTGSGHRYPPRPPPATGTATVGLCLSGTSDTEILILCGWSVPAEVVPCWWEPMSTP